MTIWQPLKSSIICTLVNVAFAESCALRIKLWPNVAGLVDAPMTTNNLGDYGEILGLSKDDMAERMLQRVPIGRFLTSDEVAHLAVYLAADESLSCPVSSVSNTWRPRSSPRS